MKGFVYTMLILSAIVFLYRQGFAFPDLATSFGELNATYNAQIYHTPLGDFSANGEAQRFNAAAGNLQQNYYQNYYPTSSAPTASTDRVYPRN
jgi:hypothetical protein